MLQHLTAAGGASSKASESIVFEYSLSLGFQRVRLDVTCWYERKLAKKQSAPSSRFRFDDELSDSFFLESQFGTVLGCRVPPTVAQP